MTDLEALAARVEVPHPSEFIAEELLARGWSADQLAWYMCDGTDADYTLCRVALDFYDQIGPREPKMYIGDITAGKLGKAFNVSPQYFIALEDKWRAHLTAGATAIRSLPLSNEGESR